MKNIYIGLARDSHDIEAALLLAAKTFNTSKDLSKEAFKNKKILLSPNGSFDENDVVILANGKNEVCGTCFLVDRDFYRNGIKLKSTFLSSICISKSFRGKGFSRLLMDEAIKKCEERGSSFAVLIARKAVDYFYNKFSFWGLSEYSKINLKIIDKTISSLIYSVLPATDKDLAIVNKIYDSIYSKLYGSCKRSNKYWKYVLWKTKVQQFNFLIFRSEDKVIGYVIFQENDIYEIASTNNISSLEFLYMLRHNYSMNNIKLHCSNEHPIISELKELDFSINRRQCIFGGHMVRIIDEDYLFRCLEEEVQQKALKLGISNHTEIYGDNSITIQDNRIDIKMPTHPYSYENTCFLMMADRLSVVPKKNILYKPYSFNIPYLDQI